MYHNIEAHEGMDKQGNDKTENNSQKHDIFTLSS